MDKERIIELIIVKNRSFDLGTGRKIRRTLSLRNFQRKKFEPYHQEEHIKFWFWLKEIVKSDLRLTEPQCRFSFGSRESLDGISS